MLDDLQKQFDEKQRVLTERVGARNSLNRQLDSLQSEVLTLTERMRSTEKAVYLLQQYSEDQQSMLAERIEVVVTAGLRAVFQNPSLLFKLHYSESKKGSVKKTPEVTMRVWHNYGDRLVDGDLQDSFGGGLAVVTAALLNIIVVLQLVPRVAPIILWDEPLKDLSPEYEGAMNAMASGFRERMADFVRTLTEQTPVQIVMVSHEPEYGRVADYHHRFSGGVDIAPTVKTYKRKEEA